VVKKIVFMCDICGCEYEAKCKLDNIDSGYNTVRLVNDVGLAEACYLSMTLCKSCQEAFEDAFMQFRVRRAQAGNVAVKIELDQEWHNNASVSERIRRIRKEKGLTQKQLASRLGVSQAMITKYEQSLRKPKIGTIVKIADALDVDVSEVLDYGGLK